MYAPGRGLPPTPACVFTRIQWGSPWYILPVVSSQVIGQVVPLPKPVVSPPCLLTILKAVKKIKIVPDLPIPWQVPEFVWVSPIRHRTSLRLCGLYQAIPIVDRSAFRLRLNGVASKSNVSRNIGQRGNHRARPIIRCYGVDWSAIAGIIEYSRWVLGFTSKSIVCLKVNGAGVYLKAWTGSYTRTLVKLAFKTGNRFHTQGPQRTRIRLYSTQPDYRYLEILVVCQCPGQYYMCW